LESYFLFKILKSKDIFRGLHHGRDAMFNELVDEVVIEVDPLLIQAVDHASRHDASPSDGETEDVQLE
jgi:hypothetical protein